jgi:uncharacterized delta-60 repeat protein
MKKWNLSLLALLLCIAAMAQDGSRDALFVQAGGGLNSSLKTVALQADGKILAGGFFSRYNGIIRQSIARFYTDGTLDPNFTPAIVAVNTTPNQIVVQADGKILVAGYFPGLPNSQRFLVRLNDDGSIDNSFAMTGTGLNGGVTRLAVMANGQIVAVGAFTSYNGVSQKYAIRLNADGTQDPSFVVPGAGFDDEVDAVAVQPDGKIIVGGRFYLYDDQDAQFILRLNTNGSIDNNFVHTGGVFQGPVLCIALESNGNVMVGGGFTRINGVNRQHIARLTSSGTVDATFNNVGTGISASPTYSGEVQSIAIQNDGKYVIGGYFDRYNGTTPAHGLARLNNNGSFDNSFTQTGTGLNQMVYSAVLQTDGKVVAGGDFTTYDGVSASYLIRINNTVADVIPGSLPNTTYCAGASFSIPYTVTGTFNGINSFRAQLSDASGSFANPVNIGSISSSVAGSISATIPNPITSGTNYRVRITASSPSLTGGTSSTVLTLNPTAPASIAYTATPYFAGPGTATVTLTGTTGGNFSAAPVGLTLDATTGTIDLANSSPGNYTVSYMVNPGGGCGLYTTTAPITLNSNFSATINYPGSPYCSSTGTVPVVQTGTAGGTYFATPAGLNIDAATGAIDLAASSAGSYTVRYMLFGSTTFTQVIIRPAAAFTSPANQVVCAGASTTTMNFAATPGFSVNWTNSDPSIGLAASGSGNIAGFVTQNPNASPVTSVITFNSVGGTSCQFRGATRVTVKPIPVLTAIGDQTLCTGLPTTPVSFSSTVSGTTTSWTNNNTTVGLGAAGTGNIPSFSIVNNTGVPQMATITATPVAAGCAGTPISFTMSSSPSVQSITYQQPSYCQGGYAYAFRRGSAGGGFSATPAGLLMDANTGQINLALSQPGTYTVTYTVTASGGCAGTASTQLQVLPQASVSPLPNQTFCNGIVTPTMAFTGTAAAYNWTNDNAGIGLAASGSGTSLPSFTTTNAGPGTLYATIRVSPQGNNSTQCPGRTMAFRIAVSYCGPIAHHEETSGDNGSSRMSAAMTISPNPASAKVMISVTESGSYLLQVIDRMGTPVSMARSFTGNGTQLDISNLLPGSYVIRITNKRTGQVHQRQVVKL